MALSKRAKQIKDAVEGEGQGIDAMCGRVDTKGTKIPQRLPTQTPTGQIDEANLNKLYEQMEKGWEGTAADTSEGSPYGNVLGRVKITRAVKSSESTPSTGTKTGTTTTTSGTSSTSK